MYGGFVCENEYRLCYVAYADILGFKNKINKSVTDNDTLNEILSLQKYLETIKKSSGVSEKKAYFISDSIFLVFPFEKNEMSSVLWEIADMQAEIINKGFLIRGGLTIGMVVFSDTYLFGPSVNEVVQIEQQIECPCVALSYRFFENYLLNINKASFVYDDLEREMKDASEYLSSNESFKWISHVNKQDLIIDKVDIKRKLLEMISDNKDNPNERIKSKYIWLERNIDYK